MLALVAVFALEVYVVSSAWVVTGGYGYGARRLSDGAPLFALGVGLLWARLERIDDARATLRTWLRRALAAFVALCVLLNLVAMELCARRRSRRRAARRARPSAFSTTAGCRASAALFGAIGYPFVQPAGWLFALRHHVPASAFENVVGNWFLDRDGQWLQVQTKGTALDVSARGYVRRGWRSARRRRRRA